MKCISIPECTQRLSHLTSGGQHGQESEEGEEGEERSEEDCEEDPQGREEEVTRLDLIAGGFVAGTSFEADRGDLNSPPKARTTQRGCRRDIRSNGWIELRTRRSRRLKPVRQKKIFFVRCGWHSIRNVTGTLARWDLILTCSPTPSFPAGAGYARRLIFPDIPGRSTPDASFAANGTHTHAMVIALPKPRGKRFIAFALSADPGILFRIPSLRAPPLHLRGVHRDA
jgi:hypothetical protein